MYNSSTIDERIKAVAKRKKISLKTLLADTGLGFNTMSNMKTSMPKSDNLAKIADYLDCSVDYLLGRAAAPASFYGDGFTAHDKILVEAYKKQQPALRQAVDKILGIEAEEYNFSGSDLSRARVAAFGGAPQSDPKIDYSALSKALSEDNKE